MIKKCIGCGITLQSTNPSKDGFIPLNTKNENRYCTRCFKIMHYNEIITGIPYLNNTEIIKIVNSKAKYVLFLIDYLNINQESINKFKEIICDKTLIISKADLISKNIKENKIKNWLKKYYEINDNIELISSKKEFNIKKIINNIDLKNTREIYILGYTNAGKSTFINTIAKKFNIENNIITTSINPNTTLDFIKFKISSSLVFIDTPGFNSNNILGYNDIDFIKKANAKNIIKPITYQCKKNICFNIENKILINFLNQENSITFYISNQINIEKKFNILENNKLNKVIISLKPNQDIVVKGLGFINVKKACEVILYIDNKNIIEIRNSFFEV